MDLSASNLRKPELDEAVHVALVPRLGVAVATENLDCFLSRHGSPGSELRVLSLVAMGELILRWDDRLAWNQRQRANAAADIAGDELHVLGRCDLTRMAVLVDHDAAAVGAVAGARNAVDGDSFVWTRRHGWRIPPDARIHRDRSHGVKHS
jgi:hypothetical protein